MRYLNVATVLFLALANGCDEEESETCCSEDASVTDDRPACPVNSGWPCACDADQGYACEDGSPCVVMSLTSGGEVRYCAHECATEDEGCPSTPYDGEGDCRLYVEDNDTWLCTLLCWDSMDCPPGQECADWAAESGLMCLPQEDG